MIERVKIGERDTHKHLGDRDRDALIKQVIFNVMEINDQLNDWVLFCAVAILATEREGEREREREIERGYFHL